MIILLYWFDFLKGRSQTIILKFPLDYYALVSTSSLDQVEFVQFNIGT